MPARAHPDRTGLTAGASVASLLAVGIVLGSEGLRHYDLALLPYTIGVVLASFAVAYRYAVWLRRPPTQVYWTRGWQLFLRREDAPRNVLFLLRSAYDNLFAQKFIHRRGGGRWIAHFCLAWGCLLAGAVTFPLVFGWMHFETRAGDPRWYRVLVVGAVVGEFHTRSLARYVVFNLLNVSAVMVIFGAGLALRRRLLDPGTMARQQFGNDIVPLLLLIAISATGLMLTFSMHVLHGRGYPVISLVHAFTVTATLLYLPFGKLFHVFQRPAQLGVAFYRRANEASPPATCRVCGEGFAGRMHVDDLKGVLSGVGLDWPLPGRAGHYADVCPRCRRRLVGFTQGLLMERS
ncbi:MAG: MFS transporter [Acidobacteria bacterium]|nr:MAG: MFS transporter [Acidobacteriota bacterium]